MKYLKITIYVCFALEIFTLPIYCPIHKTNDYCWLTYSTNKPGNSDQ